MFPVLNVDMESAVLLAGVLAITTVTLLVIRYLFRSKSYEEMIAEQRQQNNSLYNNQQQQQQQHHHQQRSKPKQKQKKANKKVKEKTDEEEEHVGSEEERQNAVEEKQAPSKPVEKVDAEEYKEADTKKREVHIKAVAAEAPAANNPKLQIKEEPLPKNPNTDSKAVRYAVTQTDFAKDRGTPKKTESPKRPDIVEAPAEKEVAAVVKAAAPVAAPVPKDKKKKKSDLNTIQHLADTNSLNINSLLPLVKKAELSRGDLQTLIDALLDIQQDSRHTEEEWSEGKADPIIKLKKQLNEKDKQIAELQESVLAAQAKVKDVRDQSALESKNRAQLVHNYKLLQETLAQNKADQGKHVQKLTQAYNVLQEQCNEEAMKGRKVYEEYTALQLKIQQLEHHLAQNQEAERNMTQMHSELMEKYKLVNMTKEKYLDDLNQKEGQIAMYMHKDNEYQLELSRTNSELLRTSEELRRLEHSNFQDQKIKDDLDKGIAMIKNELQNLKTELAMVRDANDQLNGEKQKAQDVIDVLSEDKDNILHENVCLVKSKVSLEGDLAKLRKENTKLQDERTRLEEEAKKISESVENGKQTQLELNKLEQQATLRLQQQEESHAAELQALRDQLQTEVDEQKNKNNDLRQKNWKLMEALNAAESRVKSVAAKQPDVSSNDKAIAAARLEEQEHNRQFVERLFPDAKIAAGQSYKSWQDSVARAIENHQQDRSRSDHVQQVESARYKKAIGEMELVLKALEKKVVDEEVHWREEIRKKDEQIDRLSANAELQTQLTELSHELETERRLTSSLRSNVESEKTAATNLKTMCKKQLDDIQELQAQLKALKAKQSELVESSSNDSSPKAQNHTNGPAPVSAENN